MNTEYLEKMTMFQCTPTKNTATNRIQRTVGLQSTECLCPKRAWRTFHSNNHVFTSMLVVMWYNKFWNIPFATTQHLPGYDGFHTFHRFTYSQNCSLKRCLTTCQIRLTLRAQDSKFHVHILFLHNLFAKQKSDFATLVQVADELSAFDTVVVGQIQNDQKNSILTNKRKNAQRFFLQVGRQWLSVKRQAKSLGFFH